MSRHRPGREVRAWARKATDAEATLMPFVDGLINIVLLLVILVVLVVIHEFGHFVVARRAGVRVHEFGIGFPPRARDPAPGQGDGLHPQLAAHRRLRAAGRGGGRLGRPAHLRPPAPADAAGHPARGRGHELPAGVAASSRHRRARGSRRQRARRLVEPGSPAGASGSRVASRSDRRRLHGSADLRRVGDLILAIDGQRFPVFDDPHRHGRARRSPTCGARRAGGHPDRAPR